MTKRTDSGREAGREAWSVVADLWFSDEFHQRFHEACEAIGVTPPQLKALQSIEPGDGIPMRAIAELLRCDASWVTGLVDGLEERGFVERRVLPTDRRVKAVTITPLGEKAKKQAREVLHEPPGAFDKLTVEERRQLRDLLRKAVEQG